MSYQKKYKSILGADDLINAPNYLAEQIIVKRAKQKGIKLPNKIWDKKFKNKLEYKYWHNAYIGEVIHATKILKEFDESCVIKALDSYRCKPILTLKNQKLRAEAKELQNKKEQQELIKEEIVVNKAPVNTRPRRPLSGTKTKLGKLK